MLKNPVKLVDKCKDENGVPPEPASDAVPGITFAKQNPGKNTGNCDTDRNNYTEDCRWENCRLPGSLSSTYWHMQMTVAIFVR